MKSLTLPTNDYIGDRLIDIAFNTYDRDFLNGKEPDVTIADRVQLTINQYELHKHELYWDGEYSI